jgi:hypothetical protein
VLRDGNQVGVTADYRVLEITPDRILLDYGSPDVAVTFTRIRD